MSDAIIDSHVALGADHHLALDDAELLRRMDASHISLALARPMGADLVVHNHHHNTRPLPPRIKRLATANPWYGIDAIRLLNESPDAVGLYLHPTRQGFMPTDPVARPLYEFAEQRRWPVVIHTGTYIQSDVLAVAEAARDHPSILFVCDAAGWTDMWFELPSLLADVPNLLFCASMIWAKAIANTIAAHGASRILFGSGEPRDRVEAALKRIDRLELSVGDRRAILSDNAKRVFKL